MKLALLMISIMLSVFLSLVVIFIVLFAEFMPKANDKVQYLEDRLMSNIALSIEQLKRKQDVMNDRDIVEDRALSSMVTTFQRMYEQERQRNATTPSPSPLN